MNVKSTAKGIIGILFAIFMLAGVVMCDRPATATDPDLIDTPDNGRDRPILQPDSNGTNEPNS
ncbi:MAG: hypothetical protein MJ002_03355 [Paludibacteraceae bacterium]|nr:hypothetical protein [Paludibacteraceae bacterium]